MYSYLSLNTGHDQQASINAHRRHRVWFEARHGQDVALVSTDGAPQGPKLEVPELRPALGVTAYKSAVLRW